MNNYNNYTINNKKIVNFLYFLSSFVEIENSNDYKIKINLFFIIIWRTKIILSIIITRKS